MDRALAPLAKLFELNTSLLLNCLDGLDELDATVRPSEHTNNVAFIAAHLVETRAWMGGFVGVPVAAPFDGLLAGARGIDDLVRLPPLAEIRDAWGVVSPPVAARLATLGRTELEAPGAAEFPGVPPTVLGGIAFLVQHESYHIGQLAYLRKYLGSDPMSYR